MPVPYHTHNFELPIATKQDVAAGIAADKVVVPAALGSAATVNIEDFATAVQGQKADLAVPPQRQIIVGDGLQGGGNLSEDRTISLAQTTLEALKKANNAAPKTVSISAGSGLTGGGDLSNSSIELSLNTTSLAALSKAQSAVQAKDLGSLATKNKIVVSDITATGSASSSSFLRGDGSWVTISTSAGSGNSDMQKSIYDPNNIGKDIYNADNISEGDTHKFLTASEKTQIAKISSLQNADNITEGDSHKFVTSSEKTQIAKIAGLSDSITNLNSDNITQGSSNLFLRVSERSAIAAIVKTQNSFAGQIAFFPCQSAPDGWIKANGALLSRTEYAELWKFASMSGIIINDSNWNANRQGCFSYGDGFTTFRIPDLRGEFLRGFDDGRGVDTNRVLGSNQGDAIRNITGAISAAGAIAWQNAQGAFNITGGSATYPTASLGIISGLDTIFDASRVVPTAQENRPRNVALLACIKY